MDYRADFVLASLLSKSVAHTIRIAITILLVTALPSEKYRFIGFPNKLKELRNGLCTGSSAPL